MPTYEDLSCETPRRPLSGITDVACYYGIPCFRLSSWNRACGWKGRVVAGFCSFLAPDSNQERDYR